MNTFFTPDLIFFIVVAAFLILRLKSVLGRRTGNEKRQKDVFFYQDTTLNDKSSYSNSKKAPLDKAFKNLVNNKGKKISSVNVIAKIYSLDENFNTKKFLDGAKSAFETIIKSYAKGEIDKIKSLLGSNVFSTFSKNVKLRIKKKNVLEHSLISIKSVDIENINVKESIADIVVKFVSEQVNLLKNEKGKILEGDNEYVENHIDYWTFSKDLKSSNPNWKLIVTKTG